MKLLLIVTMLTVLSCLPQEKGRSAGVERERLKAKPCPVHFEKGFSLRKISEAARKMKIQCNLSQDEVIRLAKEVYH